MHIQRKAWRRWGRSLGRFAFYGLMSVGVWLMWSASTSYIALGEEHPFYLEKLPLPHPQLWLGALYVHVPAALVALPACLVLLSDWLRARWPRVHRWLGRVTAALIVFAVVPSGTYLAFFAQGGWPTTLGFVLTGAIAFVAMIRSVVHARRGEMKLHRRYSMHVTAQLAVAVFSRFMLIAIEEVGLYSEAAYVAALWVPVLGGVIVTELLTRPRSSLRSKGTHHEARVAVFAPDALRQRGLG